MRRQVRKGPLLSLALLFIIVGTAPQAGAYQTYPLTTNTAIKPGAGYVTLPGASTPVQYWAAGETHAFQGVLEATSPSVKVMLVGARVRCDSGGAGVQTTQNHPVGTGHTRVVVNYIWTPSSPGTYACHLEGETAVTGTVVSTDYITALATKSYLLFSDGNYTDGVSWHLETDCRLNPSYCFTSTNPSWDGTIHIGVMTNSQYSAGTSTYVLHSSSFTPNSSATHMLVRLDAELTVCYPGTASCPPGTLGTHSGGGSSGSWQMISTQLNSSGGNCSVTHSSLTSWSITATEHHKKIPYASLPNPPAAAWDVPISGSCARNFIFKLYVSVSSSDNPVQVEAAHYSIGDAVGAS